MTRDFIKKYLKEVVNIDDIRLDCPGNRMHGDYATNIALQIDKKNAMKIASQIKNSLEKKDLFEKIEVVNPGFVNFFLSKKYLASQVKEILKAGDKYGSLPKKKKRIQVEFISANPTGPLTVGNARGGPFGNTLANVLKKAGFKAEKAYYINDCGMQILTLGHSVLKDDQAKYKGEYIDLLHKKIKSKDPLKAGEAAAKLIIKDMIKKTTDRMKIDYDEWISEKSFYLSGEVDRALSFFRKKGLIYTKDKAEFFKSSYYGDGRDRVMIKSDGSKTYLAGDIALHDYKFKKFDKVINVWGSDHHGDVSGLQAVVEALGHKGKLDIVLLQFVTLFEEGRELKMSKRKGVYITMEKLLDEVGSDAVNFFFLQKSPDTHLKFDLSLAKEQSEKNPVYYVQYANARISSILKKAKKTNSELKFDHPSELSLIKELIRFPEIIEDISNDYQVQRLTRYAIDLASLFHRFYKECKVLEGKNFDSRLNLIKAVQIVIKNTLGLMGISVPNKM